MEKETFAHEEGNHVPVSMEGHQMTAIAPAGGARRQPVPLGDLVEDEQYLLDLIQKVMREGVHYGAVPGVPKKFPWKPAFETLLTAYKLVPRHRIQKTDLDGGHREYEVLTDLFDAETGGLVCGGVGMASSMEPRYRYTAGPAKFTGKPVPKEYWNIRKTDPKGAVKIIGGPGHVVLKNPETEVWEIAERGEKVDVPDPADKFNTVLKQAKKRSLADAVLTATRSSGYFAPDLIDEPDTRGAYGVDDENFPASDDIGPQRGNGSAEKRKQPPQRRSASAKQDNQPRQQSTQKDSAETLRESISNYLGNEMESWLKFISGGKWTSFEDAVNDGPDAIEKVRNEFEDLVGGA